MIHRDPVGDFRILADAGAQAGELGLVDRDVRPDLGKPDRRIVDDLRADLLKVAGWKGGAGPVSRRRLVTEETVGDPVGHHVAVHRLGRPGGPPSDEGRAPAGIGEDVPERLDLAPAARDRRLAAGAEILHQKIDDAMLLGRLAGGDARPEKRREHREHRFHVPPGPPGLEARQIRKLPAVEERPDDLPVGAVEPENRDLHAGAERPPLQGRGLDRGDHLGGPRHRADPQDRRLEAAIQQAVAQRRLHLTPSLVQDQVLARRGGAPGPDRLRGDLADQPPRAAPALDRPEQLAESVVVDLRGGLVIDLETDPFARLHRLFPLDPDRTGVESADTLNERHDEMPPRSEARRLASTGRLTEDPLIATDPHEHAPDEQARQEQTGDQGDRAVSGGSGGVSRPRW